MICNYFLCCTMEEVTGQQLTPEGARFPVFCSDHIPFLFLPHTLSFNSPKCTDFACSAGGLWSFSLKSPGFLCLWYCFRMLARFTFFPFIKSSIILWWTTHLLCVYRNREHLSKMNSQVSEDSAEAVLLSGWKLSVNFMLHTSPTGITWVLGKCHHFPCKRHRSCFAVTEVKTTTLIFFFFKAFILEQLFFMHPLKALPQAVTAGKHKQKARACSHIQHRLTIHFMT